MAARIIDGKAVAERRRQALTERVRGLVAHGTIPCLAAVTVRADHGWEVYARNQAAACARVGIRYRAVSLPAGAGPEDLAEAIEALNVDPAVHGIILQAPLPEGFDGFQAQARISPDKDVEGVNPANLGLVLAGRPALAPCTALAAVACAREALPDLTGVEAVVVGASTIVGKPVAQLLLAAGATVRVCHIHTRDLAAHTRQAELLVVAVGKAGLIRAEHVRPGAVVVDVGINRAVGADGKAVTVGDVDPGVAAVAGALTPVPGGVGSLTTTILLESTADAAERLAGEGRRIDGAEVARLLGGLDLPAGAADRIATLLARHLVGLPAGATRPPLERRLAAIAGGAGALILDGAMATALAGHGIAPERALDANLDHPEAVLAVHRAYLAAGAQVLTANTFGASRHRCGSSEAALRHLAAGLRLARQAAAGRALVLASLGPLGPVVGSDISEAEAEEAFAELALACADGLADGVILETFTATAEARAALAAVRRTGLGVIACRHFERADATEIAEFAQAMEAGGALAVGANCGAGPRALAPVVERLCAATRLPVLARPNAGHPVRGADGALHWHLRPAWLVEQAQAYLAAGAGILGGCCGVHAEHIRALAALAGAPVPTRGEPAAPAPAIRPALPAHPLLAALRAGAFPVLGFVPGRLAPAEADAALGRLARAGAAAVGLAAGWPGAPRTALLTARLRHAQDACGAPGVLDLPGGACPLAEAEERLLAAHLLGLRLVVVDDRVFSSGGTGGGADAAALVALIRTLNHGRDRAGRRLEEPTAFAVGVRIAAGADAAPWREAGADFLCLQPVYEPARFRAWMDGVGGDLPLVMDLLLLPDAATAEELENELPALAVPARLKERLARDPSGDVGGALRFLAHWRHRLAGVCLHTADARTTAAEALLGALRAG